MHLDRFIAGRLRVEEPRDVSDRGNSNDRNACDHDVEQPSGIAHEEHAAIDHHPRLRLVIISSMTSLLNTAYDSLSSAFRRGLIKVLTAGPVPQHIAFVMDGNRRYARQRNMAVKQGHTDGFYALRQVRPSSILFQSLSLTRLIV